MTLSQEGQSHLREADLRDALRSAHYVAAINREITGEGRRTRLSAESAQSLAPMQVLKLYLDGREMEQERRDKILSRGEALLEEYQNETL